MKKLCTFLIISTILIGSTFANAFTDADVTKLVDQTVKDIAAAADPAAVFAKIKGGAAPYKDPANPGLYVFVYDPEVNMAAHPDSTIDTKNFKGKPDVCGCKFRDEIVNSVLGKKEDTKCKNENNWVHYVYKNPAPGKGLEHKKTYYKSVKAKNGNQYIVCSGIYVAEMKGCNK